MVSGKGIERPQLIPPWTKLLRGVFIEATYIWSYHLYSEYLIEKVAIDGRSQKFPTCNIISSPMSCKVTCSNAVASGNDEWTFSFFFQVLMSWYCCHMTIISMLFPVKKGLFAGCIMRNIHVYSHLINAFILLNPERLCGWLVSSEVGRFIHIKPYSWKLDLLV